MHVLSPLPFLTLLGTTLAFRASPPHQRADVPTANITILVPSTGAHPTFLLKTDGSYVSMSAYLLLPPSPYNLVPFLPFCLHFISRLSFSPPSFPSACPAPSSKPYGADNRTTARARPGTILLEKEEGVNVRCEIDLVDGRTETLGPDVLSVEVVPETNTKGGSCVLV